MHEKDYKALSNMPVERVVTRADDGFVESHFKESLKMSTYLLAFIVCDFAYKETHLKSGKKVCLSGCFQVVLFAQYHIQTYHYLDLFSEAPSSTPRPTNRWWYCYVILHSSILTKVVYIQMD